MLKSHLNLSAIVRFFIIIVIMVIAFKVAFVARDSEVLRQFVLSFGYVGILVIAFISGLNLIVPIPAVAFMPLFIESGFSFWITLGVITVGMTIADSVAYWLGREGRSIVSEAQRKGRLITYFDKLLKKGDKMPMIVLLLYAAFAPLPNEVLVIPMGFVGYRLSHIFPIVLIGNAIFNILFAFGVVSLFNLL